MENQDNINDLFKNASQKEENKDFPGMDKVWSQVEQKLDTKVLTRKSNLWKKIAVVTTIIAVISLGYQFFTSEKNKTFLENKKTVIDSTKIISLKPLPTENKIVVTEINSSTPQKETGNKVAKSGLTEKGITASKQPELVTVKKENILSNLSPDADKDKRNSNYTLRGNVFDAIGIHHTTADTVKPQKIQLQKKAPPLLVIDGEAVTNSKKSAEKKLSEMNREELEDVIYLKEPLYIINGVHYSEKEMFGPNPTSPYSPLDQQEIIKLVILQDKEAVAKYGKKGEKGVVIITTKGGKPSVKK
jgi:hypothetical protein